jgi:hypothetical protein
LTIKITKPCPEANAFGIKVTATLIGYIMADLKYTTRRVKVMSKEKLPCRDYGDTKENGFVECCKNAFG